MGGKRRLDGRLIALCTAHKCYVEAFAGGAALFSLRPQPAPVEQLNDIGGDLVNLSQVIRNRLEELTRYLR